MKDILKLSILLLLINFSANAYSQDHLDWSLPITVIEDDLYDNKRPAIAVLSNGSPVVIWGKTSPDNIYFSKWDKESFTPPVKLNADGTSVFVYDWAGPEIATFGDSIFVTYKQTPELTGPILLLRSFDGGSSWEMPVTVDNNPGFITNFPAVTVDTFGHPAIVYMVSNLDYSGAHYVVARSYDSGNSFASSVLASEYSGGEVCDCCTPTIISKEEYMVTLYRDNHENIRNIWSGVSTDGGNTFTNGMQVDATDWELFACPSSGPDGIIWMDTLYSTWMSSASGESLVYRSASSLSSLSDEPDIEVTGIFDELNGQNFPRIAHFKSAACMVWQQTGSDFHSQIMIQFSEDLHEGWSAPDTIWSQSNYGLKQADVVLSENDVHIIWQDNISKRLYYTFSSYREDETNVDGEIFFSNVHVYPQPADAQLIIEGFENYGISHMQFYAVSGQKYHAEFIDGNETLLDVSHLVPGMYTLQIIAKNGKAYNTMCLIQ